MTTLDTPTLANIINGCYDLVEDADCPAAAATEIRTYIKRLQGDLFVLASAQFNDGTAALLAANNDLNAVNTALANEAQALAQVANVIQQISNLATALDGLLGLAANFR
jgi:hypothetical protein